MIFAAIFLAVWLGFGFVSNLLDEIYSRFGLAGKANIMIHFLIGPIGVLMITCVLVNTISKQRTRTSLTSKMADYIMIRFEPQKGLKK